MLVCAGAACRKAGWIGDGVDKSIVRLNINLLYPALILDKLADNPALENTSNLLGAPAIAFLTVTGSYWLCWLVAPLAGLAPGSGRRTFAEATGMYNYGFIPIPLIAMVFGERELLGVLFVHNLGVEIARWTVGVMLHSGTSLKDGWKNVFNAPVITIILGIVLNLTDIDTHYPAFLTQFLAITGAAAIPVSLILTGIILWDAIEGIDIRSAPATAVLAMAMRQMVLPAIIIATAWLLPVSNELKVVLVVLAGMPSGMFAIVLARHFGGHPPTAVVVVVATSIAGIPLIPLWIILGIKWLGLDV